MDWVKLAESMKSRRTFLAEVVALGGFSLVGKTDAAPVKPVMFWRGEIAKADVVNSNKRIYPKDVLEKEVERFKSLDRKSVV